MSDGGKGSGLRPTSVPRSVVDENWDRIFGKKDKVTEAPKQIRAVKFREHRGGLIESMETMVSFDNEPALRKHISKTFDVPETAVSYAAKVVYDPRIDWHTQYALIDGEFCGLVDLGQN